MKRCVKYFDEFVKPSAVSIFENFMQKIFKRENSRVKYIKALHIRICLHSREDASFQIIITKTQKQLENSIAKDMETHSSGKERSITLAHSFSMSSNISTMYD